MAKGSGSGGRTYSALGGGSSIVVNDRQSTSGNVIQVRIGKSNISFGLPAAGQTTRFRTQDGRFDFQVTAGRGGNYRILQTNPGGTRAFNARGARAVLGNFNVFLGTTRAELVKR